MKREWELESAGGINQDILYATVYNYSNVHLEESPHKKIVNRSNTIRLR
jgi:hypothetical protein